MELRKQRGVPPCRLEITKKSKVVGRVGSTQARHVHKRESKRNYTYSKQAKEKRTNGSVTFRKAARAAGLGSEEAPASGSGWLRSADTFDT